MEKKILICKFSFSLSLCLSVMRPNGKIEGKDALES